MAVSGRKKFGILFIAAALLCGSYSVYRLQEAKRQKAILEERKAAWQVLKQELAYEVKRFKGQAGIMIKDLRFDWEISYDKDRLFPSASLVKLPIMAACFLASEEGRIDLGRRVVLKSSDKFPGSGTLKGMRPGAAFTVEELIGFMIYDSDNTATNMLTNMLGKDYLNRVFDSLGLRNTNLSRRVADFRSRNRGIENYTTVGDMAWLLEQIYLGRLINREVSKKCLEVLKLQHYNDRIPKYLPADVTVAHKTGLERGVCHDAGIIFGRNGDILICVLTRHKNSNAAASKNFIARVALDTYNYSE